MKKEIAQYQTIYNDIYDQILSGVYRPGDQLPVELELCKKYHVSRITVQKALKLLCDKEIIYRTIGKGTFVSEAKDHSKKSNPLIGVVLCNICSSYGTEILKSIEKNAELNGYSIVFKNSDFSRQMESKDINELVDLNVAGIILQPTHGEATNPDLLRLESLRRPLVLVDRYLSGINCSFVGSDNYQATIRVMKELFIKGHRNICFVCSNPENTTSTTQRIQGFKDSFTNYGIPFKDEFIYSGIQSTMSLNDLVNQKNTDIENLKKYILKHPEITCYFSLEYTICTLVKKALKELNISLKKVSVVTFDYVSDPHIITDTAYVKQFEEEMGYQAVKLLINAINGDNAPVKLYLPTELINLNSVNEIERLKI